MRRLLFISLLLACVTVHAQTVLPKPNPPRLLVDQANTLSPEQREILEQRLDALDDSTSNQIAIVTIPSLNGDDIEEYSVKLFREWGIGGKKNNNGILILVATGDHKMWITTGYGLEGAIPDVTAQSIVNNDLKPNFRAGNYYRGFDQAVTSLGQAAAGEYHETRKRADKDGGGGSVLGIVIIIFVILIIIGSKRGGGGGGMVSRRGYGGLLGPLLWGSVLSNLGGSGRGGWGGGSGGGFGGGGGGGFGGFGGGSTGGGGAGGSW